MESKRRVPGDGGAPAEASKSTRSRSLTVRPLSDEDLLTSRLVQAYTAWKPSNISADKMKALADVFRVAEDPLVKKLESLRAAEAKGELDALDKQRGCVGESVAKAVGTTLLSAKDRSIGCLLGVMMGDCLGAAVEGYPWDMIKERHGDCGGVRNFVPCTHMGVRHLGFRYGMYTDDTNNTLALATSLAEKKGIDPADCALQYAKWWQHKPTRGCPDSAAAVFKNILKGMHHSKTGRARFPDGSFANGGAMKISPLGVACRNADAKALRSMVASAIVSTHAHPEAVDGAACLARAIGYAMSCRQADTGKKFDGLAMIDAVAPIAETKAMQSQLGAVKALLTKAPKDKHKPSRLLPEDIAALKSLGGLEFQIKAIEAVPHALYIAARFYASPEAAVINMVLAGGDTDTTASMVAGLMGALHGTSWIPVRWWDNLENGEYGRDFAVGLAERISGLDLVKAT